MNIKFVKIANYPEIDGFIDLYGDFEDGTKEFELAEKINWEIDDLVYENTPFYNFSSGDRTDECFDTMKKFLESFNGDTVYWYREDRDVFFSGISPYEYGKVMSEAIDEVLEKYTKKGLWPIVKKGKGKKK